MADTKISAMSPASTLDGSEIAPLVQSGVNVQASIADINAFTNNRASLFSNTTQVATANTPTVVTYDNIALNQNITLVDDSKITFAVDGDFVLNFSFQMENSDTQIHIVDVWVRLNGVDYPNSNTAIDVPSSHGGVAGKTVASWSIPGHSTAGDYVELVWSTTNSNVTIHATGTQTSPTRPAIPSVIAAIWQIG